VSFGKGLTLISKQLILGSVDREIKPQPFGWSGTVSALKKTWARDPNGKVLAVRSSMSHVPCADAAMHCRSAFHRVLLGVTLYDLRAGACMRAAHP
jgi:hypothetical protein